VQRPREDCSYSLGQGFEEGACEFPLGGNSGLHESNTRCLEAYFGWSGYLIESSLESSAWSRALIHKKNAAVRGLLRENGYALVGTAVTWNGHIGDEFFMSRALVDPDLVARLARKNLNKTTLAHSRQARHRCELARASTITGTPLERIG